MEKLFYSQPLSTKVGGLGQKVKLVSDAMEHAIYNRQALNNIGPQKVLISTSGSRYQIRNNKHFNILSDFFFNAASERTIVLESFDPGHSPRQRSCNKLISNNPYNLLSGIFSKRYEKYTNSSIIEFVQYLSAQAQICADVRLSDAETGWLYKYTIRECARSALLRQNYRVLFKKLGIRLLIIQCGCYGGSGAVSMISAARDLGVSVAEFQHGAITEGHDAYNFSDEILKSELFRRTLPDYLLTYGVAWNKRSNVTSKKIVIGNPLRDESRNSPERLLQNKCWITVLGDGIDTELSLDLCKKISELDCQNRVVNFRPHPLERERLKGRNLGQIQIDTNSNIYDTFGSTAILIGEVSTALYEAIGLVERIISWETRKSRFTDPNSPFEKSKLSTHEECSRVLNNDAGCVASNCQKLEGEYWAGDWKSSYLAFLEQI
jgi:hypothetical protein